MNSDRKMDDLLRGLGRETPFPVDWSDYQRTLLARMATAQRTRRRGFWLAGIAGALGGAAAAVAVVFLLLPPTEKVRAPENSHTVQNNQKDAQKDDVHISHKPDGSVGGEALKNVRDNPVPTQ